MSRGKQSPIFVKTYDLLVWLLGRSIPLDVGRGWHTRLEHPAKSQRAVIVCRLRRVIRRDGGTSYPLNKSGKVGQIGNLPYVGPRILR